MFVRRAGGLQLAVVSDALFTDTRSVAAAGLKAGEGAANRARPTLESSGTLRRWNVSALRPTLQVGLRHDGGDADGIPGQREFPGALSECFLDGPSDSQGAHGLPRRDRAVVF